MPRRRTLGLIALIALGVVPASGLAARRGTTREVRIAAFAFHPATLTASVGDTIVWRNDDIVPHTATAADSSWSSGTLAAGGARWRWVATRTGEWTYHCALHPSMTAVVVIR